VAAKRRWFTIDNLSAGEERAAMISKVLTLIFLGLTLWGCGRIHKKFFYTRVECCESKASCCTTEMCCLPRYAGGTAPQVQLSAPVPNIPAESLEPPPQEKEERKPGLLSRLNPLNYWEEDKEKAGKEESPGEKRRKEEESSFFGRLIPF
jgi:hypothetical protein